MGLKQDLRSITKWSLHNRIYIFYLVRLILYTISITYKHNYSMAGLKCLKVTVFVYNASAII